MASTLTLQNTINWSTQILRNRPFNLGSANEPALTSANLVKQAILGPPFRWRWNRTVFAFQTKSGAQDYTTLRWRAAAAVGKDWQLVDSNGNLQIATTSGTTGGTQPTWSAVLNGTTTDNTVSWKVYGQDFNDYNGDPGTTSFIEYGSIPNLATDTPPNIWNPLEPKLALDLDSTPGRPMSVAIVGEDGQGDMSFRFQPVPDGVYTPALTVQKKATLLASLSSTWFPIPDEFSYIYSWGFLALMMLYADDPRFPLINQKFVAHLLGAAQGLTATQFNIFLNNWQAITGQPMQNAAELSQGVQARGI